MNSNNAYPTLIVICLFFLTSCREKQNYITVKPVAYAHALNNPLKRFRPSLESLSNRQSPYNSIVRSYLKWNEL